MDPLNFNYVASCIGGIPDKASPEMTSDHKASPKFGVKEESDDIDTWSEFAQKSSCHGISYIAHPQHSRLRRYLWIIAVAGAFILFMYQVVDRGNDYFSYRSNVNVEVMYESEMDFPSVTLCNQNNYRLTETVRKGMYTFINGVYSGLDYTPDNRTKVEAYDLLTFITECAHQKQDLIDSCHWKGNPCDMDNDFVTTLTDFGVCYTFNPGQNGNIFNISQSGSDFGLSLVLNIEEYEYMIGPHDEAGLKVLLHDPSEIPLVQNLGFAIAPGTHTLVAVHREQIYSLRHPYGNCEHDAAPRSHCLSHCIAQSAIDVCGCRGAHMPNITINDTAVEICPVLDAYTCLKAQKSLTTSGQACMCEIPCTRVVYTPELSYAHLSRLSVDKIWLSDSAKREKLQQSYIDARETSQRANEVIATADILRYSTLAEMSKSYLKALTDLSIRDPGTLETLIVSKKNPIESREEIEADLMAIEAEHNRLWNITSTSKPDTLLFTWLTAFDVIKHFLGENLEILRKVEECAELQTNNNLTAKEFKDKCDPEKQPLASATSQANPEHAEYELYAEPVTRRLIKKLNASVSLYEDLVRTLYENSTEWDDVITSDDHLECLNLLKNLSDTWMPKLIKMNNQLRSYYYTDSFAERRDISYDLLELSNWTKNSYDSLTRNDMFKICSWYQVGKEGKDPAIQSYKQYVISVQSALVDSLGLLKALVKWSISVAEEYQVKSVFLFRPFQQYMQYNLTKIDLYKHVKSSEFTFMFSGIEAINSQIKTDTNFFLSKIQDLEYNLVEALKQSCSFSVWVMRDPFVHSLKLINYLNTNYKKDHFVQNNLARFNEGNCSSLPDRISYVFSAYRTEVQKKVQNITMMLSRLEDHMTKARQDLVWFEKESKLNAQFFMDNYIKVDIFYKELSYDQISQQVAFEFISYLSEVGGFMGLLLGASVLTICELVDYLSLASVKRCFTQRMN